MLCVAFLILVALCIPVGAQANPTDPRSEQLLKLQALLRDKDFALEMAEWLDAAYYKGQGQVPPPFVKPEDETATVQKSVKEEKIAINLAGFYALEAGIGYLSERDGTTPKEVLATIVDGSLDKQDMLLLARFANATWKASQPFRSLSRITRDSFKPAVLLSDEELQKDYVQIENAATKLLEAMDR